MNRKICRIVSLLFALVFLLSSLGGVTAAEELHAFPRTKAEEKEYITKIAEEIDVEGREFTVAYEYALNCFTSQKSYVLYELSPSGYAIYDQISGIVEELILDSDNPYKEVKNGTMFYGGPMNYIAKLDNKYLLINENTELSERDVVELTSLEAFTVENRQKTAKGNPSSTEYYYMSSSTYFTSLLGDKFGTNTTGTCTQLACAIMLGFYDVYVNSQFVPDGYRDGYGTTQAFHLYLQTFMGTSGCFLSNAASGLNSYFSAIFFTLPTAYYNSNNHNTVFTKVSNRVYNNRPTVISMFSYYNPSCPIDHSVVAYGYRTEITGGVMTSAAYFVHNGWHNTKLGTYAWDWFRDDLYIS